jgi:hypothetical protein
MSKLGYRDKLPPFEQNEERIVLYALVAHSERLTLDLINTYYHRIISFFIACHIDK